MLKNDIFKKAEDLKNKLLKNVYDQNDAIEDIINALIQSNYKEHTNLPRCIFTFIGANSSGKAYLAQKIADGLTDITNFRSFNMAQFTNVEEGYFLYAISPDKESNQEGELIRFVREYPQSVLLFEDIDKADPQVQFNLLTVLTHNEGMIDFSKCIVVFSTSLGRELYQSSHFLNSFKLDKIRTQARLVESLLKEKKIVMDTIQSCFSPKIVSFMAQNTIILFKSLSLNANSKIGLNSLNSVLPSFMEKTGVFVELETPEILSKLITLSFSPYINALLVQKKLPELVFSKVTEFIKKE
ncbi:MAG: AAA family ATPase, partial [Candidatus Sericytochromatia bacterium]